MKLLYCQLCGDIVAPFRTAREVRYCVCKSHAVWWEDPRAGILRVCDMIGHPALVEARNGSPSSEGPQAYVIGLHNLFLQYPYDHDAASINTLLEVTPDSYLFKQQRTPAVRFRPGETSDTAWSKLPSAYARHPDV